jgi:hypothetical protein
VRQENSNADALAATAGGTRSYTADNAQACIDAVNKIYTVGKVLLSDLIGNGSMGDTCERVFQGTSDKNKSCTSDYDCTNSRICSPTAPGSSSRVCADKTDAALGDFCANPGSVCAAGSYCAVPTMVGVAAQCTAKAQTGQPCSATIPCVETLRCSAGTCVARVTAGACTTNDDCSPTAGYCDPNAGNICTVGLTFATGAADCKAYTTSITPMPDAGTADSSATDSSASDSSSSDATSD